VRVLTLTNWYPPHHYGGYELSCLDVMTRLASRGHEVAVLCSDQRLPSDPPPPDPAHELRVERSLRMYHDGEDLVRPGWRGRLAIERHNRSTLAAALDRHRPDVVSVWHLAGLSQGLLALLAERRIPVVYAVCDEWPAYAWKLDPWAKPFVGGGVRRAAGRLVERVTGVPTRLVDAGPLGPALWVTDDLRERTASRLTFAAETVVYSGIDRTVYPSRSASSDEREWSGRLVASGRFDPRKGFETAIRALPLLPEETTLALWGRGGEAERARLRRIAEALGVADRVTMGTRERDEMPAAYASGDLFVFPSEWAEPFGLVPIEAMACGTPVVATGVGGSSEFLRDGENCLLFRPGDAEDLARVVKSVASDPALRASLVAAGHRTAEAMDVERLADAMESWHLWTADGMTGPTPAPRTL
jgi:glycosyltransferase involved in cell wall biosynthesis